MSLLPAVCFLRFDTEHVYNNAPEVFRLLPVGFPIPFHFAAHERGNLFGQEVGAA